MKSEEEEDINLMMTYMKKKLSECFEIKNYHIYTYIRNCPDYLLFSRKKLGQQAKKKKTNSFGPDT